MGKKLKEVIEKVLISPVFISLMVFLLAALVVYRLTITKVDSAYDKEFIRDVLVEAHGMLFDILIIGTFIFALHTLLESRREKKRNIQRWREEIDDFRYWESDEAKFRILGNIKRLNRNGITDINLSECFLKNVDLSRAHLKGADLSGAHLEEADLRGTNLERARLSGAKLKGALLRFANLKRADLLGTNLKDTDLRRTNLKEADLSKAHLEEAYLREANLKRADFWEAHLEEANFLDAHLEEAYFDGANLERTEKLTVEQLSQVRTLYLAKLDPELEKQIKEKYPHLLEKPKEEDMKKPDFSELRNWRGAWRWRFDKKMKDRKGNSLERRER